MTAHNKKLISLKFFITLLLLLLIFPALHSALAANTGYLSDDSTAPESAKEIESTFQAPEKKQD